MERRITFNGALRLAGIALLTLTAWFVARTVVAQGYRPPAMTIRYSITALEQGQQPVHTESFVAVRTDGSKVRPRLTTAPDGQVYEQKIVIDASKGKRIVVEGITQSLTTYALSDGEAKALEFARGQCEEKSGNEEAQILGYKVLRSTRPGSGTSSAAGTQGKAQLESWIAPELGCVPLREKFTMWDANGIAQTVFEKEALEIRLGEPDSRLFDVPAWPERTPSQVNELVHQKLNIPMKPGQSEGDKAADQAYWARQMPR